MIGNIRSVDKCNIVRGLLRIGFIAPKLDIVVSGNPEELEAFVYTLVAVKEPRVLPTMCSDSTHKNKLKCNYKSEEESPIFKMLDNLFCIGGTECSAPTGLEELCQFCCFSVFQCYNRDDAYEILNTWKSCIEVSMRKYTISLICYFVVNHML